MKHSQDQLIDQRDLKYAYFHSYDLLNQISQGRPFGLVFPGRQFTPTHRWQHVAWWLQILHVRIELPVSSGKLEERSPGGWRKPNYFSTHKQQKWVLKGWRIVPTGSSKLQTKSRLERRSRSTAKNLNRDQVDGRVRYNWKQRFRSTWRLNRATSGQIHLQRPWTMTNKTSKSTRKTNGEKKILPLLSSPKEARAWTCNANFLARSFCAGLFVSFRHMYRSTSQMVTTVQCLASLGSRTGGKLCILWAQRILQTHCWWN